MKHILVLLGMTTLLVASASAQSDPRYAKTSGLGSDDKTNLHVTRTKQPAGRKQIVYYITNRSVTGSHLPEVICRYEGRDYEMYNAMSAHKSYSQSAIGTTGSLSVQGALTELDPAITMR